MASLQREGWLIAGRGFGSGENDAITLGKSGQLGQAWEHKWMQSPITVKWVCARIAGAGSANEHGRASKLELSSKLPLPCHL